jgi:hypothetical protein
VNHPGLLHLAQHRFIEEKTHLARRSMAEIANP